MILWVRAAILDTVIAIGFFDDGGLSIVTGGKRRYIDYLLPSASCFIS
jgi:hypothetical protein